MPENLPCHYYHTSINVFKIIYSGKDYNEMCMCVCLNMFKEGDTFNSKKISSSTNPVDFIPADNFSHIF